MTIPRAVVLLMLLAAAALAPATAHAGSNRVVACTNGGVQWGNASWAGSTHGNLLVDTECTNGVLIGMRVDGGKRVLNGAARTLTFTSPPGTAITAVVTQTTDFRTR